MCDSPPNANFRKVHIIQIFSIKRPSTYSLLHPRLEYKMPRLKGGSLPQRLCAGMKSGRSHTTWFSSLRSTIHCSLAIALKLIPAAGVISVRYHWTRLTCVKQGRSWVGVAVPRNQPATHYSRNSALLTPIRPERLIAAKLGFAPPRSPDERLYPQNDPIDSC